MLLWQMRLLLISVPLSICASGFCAFAEPRIKASDLSELGMDMPTMMNNAEEIQAYFDKTYAEGKAALAATNEKELEKNWTMRSGEKIYSVQTKAEVIRMSINQTIHHRAQLGVYFRLLGIPVPPSFGPTADFPAY